MESRLIDFCFVVLLVALSFSGVTLIAYAIWKIAQELMQAMHTLLTCWEFHRRPQERDRFLADPVMRGILTMTGRYPRVAPPVLAHSRLIDRLEWYRRQKARAHDAQLIWDRRLGALLAPDEYEFLYAEQTRPPRSSKEGAMEQRL